MIAAAVWRIEEHRRRRVRSAKRPVVAHISPQPASAGLARGQHRHGGVVGMDALGREDVGTDGFDQRHQRCRAGADPVGQRRDAELDALARIGRALAVERQVQAVLGEQHMREQQWPGPAACDRMRRRRRLRDALARAAGELLAHVLDHLPLARDELQRLGHVLADLVQSPAATGAGRSGRIDDPLAWQMLGQRPARRLAPLDDPDRNLLARRRCRHLRGRLSRGGILLQLGERKLELLEDGAPFGGLSEPLMPQLGNRVLELLDQQRAELRLTLERAGARLGRKQRFAGRNDHRVRGGEVGRERISAGRHVATESQSAWLGNREGVTPLLADATSAAADASRCLPTDIPAAPV